MTPKNPRPVRPVKNRTLGRAESIMSRQESGEITPWQASEEIDRMFFEDTGILAFYSDSTKLTAGWNPDVMLFPKFGSTRDNRIPSNTGIIVFGPQRGEIVTKPGDVQEGVDMEIYRYFENGTRKALEHKHMTLAELKELNKS